jgi:hypothetical protein
VNQKGRQMPDSQEIAFTGVNGVRLKIRISATGGQWHCLDCWQFGDLPPEAEAIETERRAQAAAAEHATICPAGFRRSASALEKSRS